MSAPFNRRFALEQAVLLHTRNAAGVDQKVRNAIADTATKFYDWLEEVK